MISALNHITLAVTDIDRSFDFYRNVLVFKPLAKWNMGAYFLVGEEANGLWFCLNVDQHRVPSPCYTHYAFTVSKEQFEPMSDRIITSGAHVFKENTSPGESLYFLDPDGHKLEIHTGNWANRLAAKRDDVGAWKNVQWFV
jgi:catechol 2,3-dioxygenase-like lactoylglutathione lyase family enzyme